MYVCMYVCMYFFKYILIFNIYIIYSIYYLCFVYQNTTIHLFMMIHSFIYSIYEKYALLFSLRLIYIQFWIFVFHWYGKSVILMLCWYLFLLRQSAVTSTIHCHSMEAFTTRRLIGTSTKKKLVTAICRNKHLVEGY